MSLCEAVRRDCMASVGLEALSRHRLLQVLEAKSILKVSDKVGGTIRELTRDWKQDHPERIALTFVSRKDFPIRPREIIK